MTRLEELELRKSRLDKFWNSLAEEEKVLIHENGYYKSTAICNLIAQEHEKIEIEIARIRLSEFLDIDENFEKEVLR